VIPVVNTRHKYIFYYNPKSACSTYRRFYLTLHKNELKDKTLEVEVNHHNVVKIWPFDSTKRYKNFFRYSIVRNPYSRVVSAFLDKCCELHHPPQLRFKREPFLKSIHQPIFDFLGRAPEFQMGYTFEEFLSYLEENIDNELLDLHFRPQYKPQVHLDAFYKIEEDTSQLTQIYEQILRDRPWLLKKARRLIEKHGKKMLNPSKSKKGEPLPAEFSLEGRYFDELTELNEKYELTYAHFYSPETRKRVESIYRPEIEYYGYSFPY